MKLSFFLLATLLAVICEAQPHRTKLTPVMLSLREKALSEGRVEGREKSSATDAQVSGMLTLKDPRADIVTRSWKYFVSFTAQSFQPEGIAKKEDTQSFDLSKNNSTFMPGFELGAISSSLPLYKMVNWKIGVRGNASFSSQGTEAQLASGYPVNDARLNTTLLSIGPLFALQLQTLPKFSITLSPQYGSVNYTQTSANDFASFSKQAPFTSYNYGLDYAVSNNCSLFSEWSQRTMSGSNEIALQKESLELGTKVTW